MSPTNEADRFDVVDRRRRPLRRRRGGANWRAKQGRRVALIDQATAASNPAAAPMPPRLIRDFDIPDDQLVAKISTARMISPDGQPRSISTSRTAMSAWSTVSTFDEYLRGPRRLPRCATRIHRHLHPHRPRCRRARTTLRFRDKAGEVQALETTLVIGADGARSNVARQEVDGGDTIPYVIAYHEIIEAPDDVETYHPARCDVVYDGRVSPDFYGWVFPHGKSASVGMGSGVKGVDLKEATALLRRNNRDWRTAAPSAARARRSRSSR